MGLGGSGTTVGPTVGPHLFVLPAVVVPIFFMDARLFAGQQETTERSMNFPEVLLFAGRGHWGLKLYGPVWAGWVIGSRMYG